MRALNFLFAAALAGCISLPALAQQRPTIMIVGTTHFDNPNHDLGNIAVDDVLATSRQAEILQLVAVLAQFKPTRIAIERTASEQPEFERRLQGYVHGTYQLTADERDQIAVRMAALLHISRIDAVDYKTEPPGSASAYEFQAYAQNNGKRAQWTAFEDLARHYAEDETTYLHNHNLIEWFARTNSAEWRSADNRMYYSLLQFDDEKARPAANWIGGWHRRNLAIIENIGRIAQPGDRVLVLFGAGHSYLLDEFARETGQFEVVDVETYLQPGLSTAYKFQKQETK